MFNELRPAETILIKHKLFKIRGTKHANLGQLDTAITYYEKALAIKPDYAVSQHILNSLIGYTSKEPLKEYIKNLFDDFEEKFDDSFVEGLQYRHSCIFSVLKTSL